MIQLLCIYSPFSKLQYNFLWTGCLSDRESSVFREPGLCFQSELSEGGGGKLGGGTLLVQNPVWWEKGGRWGRWGRGLRLESWSEMELQFPPSSFLELTPCLCHNSQQNNPPDYIFREKKPWISGLQRTGDIWWHRKVSLLTHCTHFCFDQLVHPRIFCANFSVPRQ